MNVSGESADPAAGPTGPGATDGRAADKAAADTDRRARRRWLMLGAALTGVCLGMRVIGLMALPIFCDESIYLRWAQVIRGEGLAAGGGGMHWWVSLADPKPPLHFWILALVFNWMTDPLVAARLISVLAGAASVPAMMAIGAELGHVMVKRENGISGRALGAIAAILAIFCPFLAFYQRLATADALFAAESLLIVWLSLRWARRTVAGTWRAGWGAALGLGAAIGAGLLTRQGVSYTICALPVAAWLLNVSGALDARAKRQVGDGREVPARHMWWRGLAQLLLAALVAGAMWTPYLTARLGKTISAGGFPYAGSAGAPVTRTEVQAEVTRRVIFHTELTRASKGRGAWVWRNALVTFIPAWDADGNPNSGWLPLYMTPLIYVMCLAGLVYAGLRQGRAFFLLLVWAAVLVVPVVLLVENIYSRYMLAGVPPLLLAGALLLGDTGAVLWQNGKAGRAGAVGLWGVLLCLPAWEMGKQMFDWREQTLTWGGRDVLADRYQYLTGWSAGLATREAIAFLEQKARENPGKPMVIVTTNGWGTPADAVWVYLSREKNVQLYYTVTKALLRPGPEGGTYRLQDDKWLFTPERSVRLPAGAPVYFVTNDPVHADVAVPAAAYYKDANPSLPPPQRFYGVEGDKGERVAVFLVPRQ